MVFASFASVFAQEVTITGNVFDENNDPLSFVNVLLYEEGNAEPLKGATTNEQGFFEIKKIKPNPYLLIISFIGFQTHEQKISPSSNLDVGEIKLREDHQVLGETMITAKKPTIQRLADRLVFNVENTTLSSGSSWDILKRTPGVITIQDHLLIKGENATVYLNDKKVQITASELKALLEGMSGASVKSIEVITNPSSNFDAESGAILNIKTSKNVSLGYKGSIDATYTQALFPKFNFGTSQFYKNEKLDIFLNYSFQPHKEFKEDDAAINFIDESQSVFARWENDFNRTTRSKTHNANIVLDYTINDRNSISLSSNLLISPDKTFKNYIINESLNAQNQLDSTFISESNVSQDLNNIAVDLGYVHKFKKEGAKLSAIAHVTDYGRTQYQYVSTDYFDAGNTLFKNISFNTDALQEIMIYTGQLDLETPVGSTTLNSGTKVSFIKSESGIDFFDHGSGTPILNAGRSDEYLYNEKIYAGYAALAKDWEKFKTKIGLRAEQTEAEGKSISMNQINKQEYFELFPSLFLQYLFNEKHSISFDYSRRVNRPRYEDLNPFAYFLNENNFNVGNPNLIAAYSNRFTLNYTLKSKYFFDVYYYDRGNQIQTLSFQDNDNLTVRTFEQNLISATSYGFDFQHIRNITDYWFFYTYISLFHEDLSFVAIESANQIVDMDVQGVYAQISNSFTLTKDGTFSSELGGTYYSRYLFGSFERKPILDISIGLRKTLWNNRAVLSLASEDVLGKANARVSSRYLNQDYNYKSIPPTQFIRFGFTYNFGNFRLADNKRSVEFEERDRLKPQ